jgi:hypothetical protein
MLKTADVCPSDDWLKLPEGIADRRVQNGLSIRPAYNRSANWNERVKLGLSDLLDAFR